MTCTVWPALEKGLLSIATFYSETRELTDVVNYVYTGTLRIYPDTIGVIIQLAKLLQLEWLFQNCIQYLNDK